MAWLPTVGLSETATAEPIWRVYTAALLGPPTICVLQETLGSHGQRPALEELGTLLCFSLVWASAFVSPLEEGSQGLLVLNL